MNARDPRVMGESSGRVERLRSYASWAGSMSSTLQGFVEAVDDGCDEEWLERLAVLAREELRVFRGEMAVRDRLLGFPERVPSVH